MNWTRRVGDLVPVAERIRRMLGCRALLAAVVLLMWWHSDAPHGHVSAWLGWGIGWPAVTALTLFSVRGGNRVARSVLTATLLGDGLLLGAAGWAMGDLLGGMGVVIILHAVAVTLLASYRTGVRLAVWHCLVAMLVIDAATLGLLPETGSWTWAGAWPYYAALWGAVLSTAVFAALTTRKQRGWPLREFGRAVAAASEPAAVTAALAEYGLAELSGRRAAVLAYGGGSGLAALIDGDGARYTDRTGPDAEPGPGSAVRRAPESGFVLLARLDDRTEGWFASALPGARNVVVLPLAGDRMAGALVVEVGARRVERRAVENAVQAVRYASAALAGSRQLADVAR